MQSTAIAATPAWEEKLRRIALLLGRLGLAYLFFTQLFWKLPPTFGCSADFAFPVAAPAPTYWEGGSGGLCYWLGLETIYAPNYRQVLVTDLRPIGLPKIGLDISPVAQMNAVLLEGIVKPGIAVFGWLIWLAEFWIFLSMLLGLFTRLGALVSLGVSLQLFIGLANIPRPYEWEWSYGTIILLSIVLLGTAPGRWLGVDAWLRRRFATGDGWPARLVALLS